MQLTQTRSASEREEETHVVNKVPSITKKEKYVMSVSRLVVNAVNNGTIKDVEKVIEDAFMRVYNEGYKTGQEMEIKDATRRDS